MKHFLHFAVLALVLAASQAFAHHGSDGIVDDDVYAMIDEMVADTPHATFDVNEMDDVTTETTVSTRSVRDVENLIDDGLLEYASMLDGDVSLVIEFDANGGATVLINQAE